MQNNNVNATNMKVPVTMKNLKKAEVIKILAEWNHKNRESWLKLRIVNLS